ncbi:hypothetical protein [Cellulomonas sp. C5510]|uniref:hypothetical protein n=1 Tax=Cellulomonas sp. C5510 TaxID=2871170 RepID=UPI001C963BDD|nr:hypothetical protein [Cellulomonas sp. C5510]QZN86831.1 hypothetical protein K5O09_06880 [Cellulomonas sp. C5510]
MRRGWPVALLPVGLAAVLVLSSRFPVRDSALWAVDAALTQVVVLWPVVAGLAAADVIRLRRSGAEELLRSAPVAARARLLLGRSAGIAVWACLGLLLGVLGATALAAPAGSPPPWSAWPDVLLALAGVGAAAAVGTALGSVPGLRGQWVVPPLVAALGYAALALDLGGASRLVAFTGATDASVTAIEVRTSVLVAQLGVLLVGAVVAIAAVVASCGGGVPAVAAALAAAILAVPAATAWRDQVDAGVHAWSDAAGWPCAEAGDDASACLPPDQSRDLRRLAAEVAPLDARLRELDPAIGALRYQPGDPGTPRPGTVVVGPPVGDEARPDGLTWDVVLGASGCADEGGRAWTDGDLTARVRAEVAVARWLSPSVDVSGVVGAWAEAGAAPVETPPGLEEARAALVVLRSCRGAW